jgi:hypothetical protein
MLAMLFWTIVLLAAFALLNHAWLRLYLRVQTKHAADSPAWFPTRDSDPRPERSRRPPEGVQAPARRCQVIPIDAPRHRKPRRNVV